MSAYVYNTFQSVSQMKQKQGDSLLQGKDTDHEKVYVVHRYNSHTSNQQKMEVVEGQVE